ncbi:Thiol-disulfide oxidoreductase ResA [Poriferisphaera corsica]|uniref:Thiol-disulfide oxidoreductase ResA n=2 Tax=Poriferisphaera corsica TaxID=2528020 RepID=A0A517YZG7_9BACT|nr:Thiol-disulfide oxidoreductase ResA [Poriferisphaera corsica]
MLIVLVAFAGCARQAPGFSAPMLRAGEVDREGRLVNDDEFVLSENRGKYVLVFFWMADSHLCRVQAGWVQRAWERFGGRDDFTVIGLSLDDNPSETIRFTEAAGMSFPQAYLGKWEFDQVRPAYGTRGVPAVFLVNPEGKIVGVNLRDGEILDVVTEQLKVGKK